MTDQPQVLGRARCPKCSSTNCPVYSTDGVVQYRRCAWCLSLGITTTFKTTREPAQPEGELADPDPQPGDPDP